jgi:hypothetical protein
VLTKFYLNYYRFKLIPHGNIRLGNTHKGVTLRGAFGSAFRMLCCHDIKVKCEECQLQESCPYALIFEPTVPAEAKRLRLNANIPRPFIIKPPLDNKHIYSPEDELLFDLVIVGRMCAYLPYFIAAFSALASEGMGAYRSTFSLKSVTTISDEQEKPVYSDQDKVVRTQTPAITFNHILKQAQRVTDPSANPNTITIRFNIPTILKVDGQIICQPEFHHIIKRLRDRVNALAYFYCGETLAVDYKEFGEAAKSVRRIEGDFKWVEVNRYSTKRQLWHELSGFTGYGVYSGDLSAYLPLLALGQYLHVGKGAAFGNGWYEIIKENHI